MSDRITKAHLESLADRINRMTGSPEASYSTHTVGGHYCANVGNYHLDGAYGGWKLSRMSNESGGVSDITHGFVTKRELYGLMQAFIRGIEAGKETA